ncbi:unnamed protein product [Peronospora belbahrii]|uniref:Uncharacterized protein n=1 Tax=Peronospora belbahrii TaxID=622444 RepID=A0ABN8DAB1_9STRA|nr:unnamed protein product [Peronospora belbahrii]
MGQRGVASPPTATLRLQFHVVSTRHRSSAVPAAPHTEAFQRNSREYEYAQNAGNTIIHARPRNETLPCMLTSRGHRAQRGASVGHLPKYLSHDRKPEAVYFSLLGLLAALAEYAMSRVLDWF